MTSQPPSGDEVDRIALLRDPPPPPGYVDPLEDSPVLESGSTADVQASRSTLEAASEGEQPGSPP